MLILQLPWALSVNSAYRVFGKSLRLSVKGRTYRKLVIDSVLQQLGGFPEPLMERLGVKATFYPPDKRRRDLDNHWKSLLDGLTYAKVWDDDSQIDYLEANRGEKTKGGAVVIEIWELV